MQVLTTILFAVQIISALVMIGLILVQHGKAACLVLQVARIFFRA
jgi:preprotein translocase subunit SecG